MNASTNSACKNVLVFQMSILPGNRDTNHYFYKLTDNSTTCFFDGISQLEPGTKHLVTRLAAKDKKIDKIIVLNTSATAACQGNDKESAFEFYRRRITDYLKDGTDLKFSYDLKKSIEEKMQMSASLSQFASKYYPALTEDVFTEVKAFADSNDILSLEQISTKAKEITESWIKKLDTDIGSFDEMLKELDENVNCQAYLDELRKELDKLHGSEKLDEYTKIFLDYKNKLDKLMTSSAEELHPLSMDIPSDIIVKYQISKLAMEYEQLSLKEQEEQKAIGAIGEQLLKTQETIDSYQKKIRKLYQHIDFMNAKVRENLGSYTYHCLYYCCLHSDKLEGLRSDIRRETEKKISELYSDSVSSPDFISSIVISNSDMPSALKELKNMITDIKGSGEESVNIYIDVQGGDRTGIFLINSALKLIDSRKVIVKDQFSINFTRGARIHEIVSRNSEYDIDKLSSGMQAFINYGRADDLIAYLNSQPDSSVEARKLMHYIQEMGDAISICAPKLFSEQLDNIRTILDSGYWNKKTEKGSAFDVVIDELRSQFGILLDKNHSVTDEIKWFINKGFVQQALTYIEDKMPQYICDELVDYKLYKKDNGEQQEITDAYEICKTLNGDTFSKRISNAFVDRAYEAYLTAYTDEIITALVSDKENKITNLSKQKSGGYSKILSTKYSDNYSNPVTLFIDYMHENRSKFPDNAHSFIDCITSFKSMLGKNCNTSSLQTMLQQLGNNAKINYQKYVNIVLQSYFIDGKITDDVQNILELVPKSSSNKSERYKLLYSSAERDKIEKNINMLADRKNQFENSSVLPQTDPDKYIESYIEYMSLISDSSLENIQKYNSQCSFFIDLKKSSANSRNGRKIKQLEEMRKALSVKTDNDFCPSIIDGGGKMIFIKTDTPYKCYIEASPKEKLKNKSEKISLLLKLHVSLRAERNKSNHASEKDFRLTAENLKFILNYYIELVNSIVN